MLYYVHEIIKTTNTEIQRKKEVIAYVSQNCSR